MRLNNLVLLLAYLTLGNTFLPIVFTRMPFPLNSTLFYLLCWLLIVVNYDVRILVTKYLTPLYLLIIILFLGGSTIWAGRNINYLEISSIEFIRLEVLGKFVAILIYLYFIKSNNTKGLGKLALISVVFIIITSITSIIGINQNPGSVRLMAQSAGAIYRDEYTRMGIANYNFFGGIVYGFAVGGFFLRKHSDNFFRILIVTSIVLVAFFSLIKSEFTTALVLSGFLLVFGLLVPQKHFKPIVPFGIIIIVLLFVLNSQVADLFNWLSSKANEESVLYSRLKDLSLMFRYMDYNPETGSSYFAQERAFRSYVSIKSFLSNPLIGGGEHMGHAHWLDRMATLGIIGFFPYVLFIYQQYKLNMRIIRNDFKPYYFLALMGYLLLGILTTTSGSLTSSYIIFLIVPGLSFVNFNRSKKLKA